MPSSDSLGRRASHGAASLATSASSIHGAAVGFREGLGLAGVARRTLGICFLLLTVFLWTLSNFLASFIFSDATYDKPFFLVYFNTSMFAISLIPMFIRYLLQKGFHGLRSDVRRMWAEHRYQAAPDEQDPMSPTSTPSKEKLSFRETAVLSLEFCMLWFLANYFASACLEYTSVASVTILTSTSSVWTLVFGSMFGVETFSLRKLVGVVASLTGIILISMVDLSGKSDENRGSFPHKTPGQIALGDAMAFLSAVVYGIYVTVMKRRVGDEDKVNMQLFFGLVGVFNLALLWPLFFILHWTGLEPFELPPTSQIWTIIIVNAIASFVSDISWALAMLLTTPLVVTVGLSLTIPLSLIGEMVQYQQYSSGVYWVGAAVVFVSFVFVNHETKEEDTSKTVNVTAGLGSASDPDGADGGAGYGRL
ncbi:eamA-like transporter family domain-containing protein [Trichoderma breve]|uniref:EamA-like transporter family domain-containing protein n=1 Tax=Trichoderma breve TaxID=2034170 RepID=A0A9W9JQ72_9HYPO|nr:eamA-like transporter family domain-containing protein [Trichoderma breve]KAJ4863849.1 eamA-like transporter family domain-containing protein [Trichoderma breve]